MVNLLGTDEDAKRLQEQTYLLTEFLAKKAPDYKPPQLHRKAVVHQHCHHKSVLDKAAEAKIVEAIGLDYEAPDTGCCGMAGAFGFETSHYDVSVAVGSCCRKCVKPKNRHSSSPTALAAASRSHRRPSAKRFTRRRY